MGPRHRRHDAVRGAPGLRPRGGRAHAAGAPTRRARLPGGRAYRSPGRTGLDLLQERGKRGADAKRTFPERLPAPAGQADMVTELSWLRTLSLAERGKAYLHSYDKNAQ